MKLIRWIPVALGGLLAYLIAYAAGGLFHRMGIALSGFLDPDALIPS